MPATISPTLLAEALLSIAAAPSNWVEAADEPTDIQLAGGVLPPRAGMGQRNHRLLKHDDGTGELLDPENKSTALTDPDIRLLKAYFINLGKFLKDLKPTHS